MTGLRFRRGASLATGWLVAVETLLVAGLPRGTECGSPQAPCPCGVTVFSRVVCPCCAGAAEDSHGPAASACCAGVAPSPARPSDPCLEGLLPCQCGRLGDRLPNPLVSQRDPPARAAGEAAGALAGDTLVGTAGPSQGDWPEKIACRSPGPSLQVLYCTWLI